MRSHLPFLLLGVVAGVASAAEAPTWSDPRHMPSLLVRWQRPGDACGMVARDGAVYVLEPGRVMALDAETGRPRWEHPIETEKCPFHWQHPILVSKEHVVAAARDQLFVIDRASGTRRHTLPLGGRFSTMWGPPVLVETSGDDRRELLSIDPGAGQVAARRRFRYGVYDLQTVGHVALVTSRSPSVSALGLPGLQPLWSTSGFSSVGVVAGSAVLGRRVQDGDCCLVDVFPVDADSGRLGSRLFRRTSPAGPEKQEWDLELIEGASGFSLRRVQSTDGQPAWAAELPARITAWCQADGRLYAHCGGTGRGFLVALDSTTGNLQDAAYGLRDVYRMDSLGDALFMLTGDGVVAVSSHELGPPEATTVPIREAVRRIVEAPIEGWNQDEALRDLEALGTEALPAIVQEVPRLSGWPLAVAASRLAGAGHEAAAPALTERLQLEDASRTGDAVQVALLDALALLGGAREVDATKSVLEAPDRSEWVRFHAFMALVTMGTPEALEGAARALEARRARLDRGFTPPSASSFLELVGMPVDESARGRAAQREDFAEWRRLGRGLGCARVSLPGGRALVVFPDDRLGNRRDLWAQEVDAGGAVAGDAVFLAAAVPGPSCDEWCPIDASLEGSALTVRRKDGVAGPVRVDLTRARLDSDGDGLADLVEGRLGTDPDRRDSDGDGSEDSSDPFPRTPSHQPSTEVEQVTAAVFEQFHLFEERTPGLAVLVSDFAVPASGREGPTLMVSPEALDAFKDNSGLDGAAFISIAPDDAGGAAVAGSIAAFTGGSGHIQRSSDSRDREYSLAIYRGPLNAVGYEIVVRLTERGWLIRSVRQAWVS